MPILYNPDIVYKRFHRTHFCVIMWCIVSEMCLFCKIIQCNPLVSFLFKLEKQWHTIINGGSKEPPPPPGSKFFQFHAVFGKIWQNRMLAPPPGEILDLPLHISYLKEWHIVENNHAVVLLYFFNTFPLVVSIKLLCSITCPKCIVFH